MIEDPDPRLPTGVFDLDQYLAYKACARRYAFAYVERREATPGPLDRLRDRLTAFVAEVAAVRERGEDFTVEMTIAAWSTPGDLPPEYVVQGRRVAGRYVGHVGRHLAPLARDVRARRKFGAVAVEGRTPLVDRLGGRFEAQVVVLRFADRPLDPARLAVDPSVTWHVALTGVVAGRVDTLGGLRPGATPVQVSQPTTRDRRSLDVLREDVEETVDLIGRGIFPRTAIDARVCSGGCGYWAICRGRP